ncbi:MAG: hypothetical protein KA998_00505 [Rickettsiaceae bacterium]|nr:hypothetical protein [Rickettsiaceae bacterium]
MLGRIIVLLYAACCLILASSCSTSVRYKSDYTNYINPNSSIAILPSKTEVNVVDLSCQKTRMYDYELFLEKVISEAIALELREHNVNASVVTRKEIHDQTLNADFESIIDNASQIIASAYVKEKKKNLTWRTTKNRDSVISENLECDLAEFRKKIKTDIIAVVEYNHISKTNGARIKDIIIDTALQTQSTPSDHMSFVIAFIDVKTGDFLWSNVITSASGVRSRTREPNRIQYFVKKLLLPLFKSKTYPKT